MDDFKWDELETDVTPGGTFAPPTARPAGKHAKTERFPCGQCGGSGRYRGVRVHQPATECFACGGKGYFMTSEADRQKARAGRAASKARKLETAVVSFADANPGVVEYLTEAAKYVKTVEDEYLGKILGTTYTGKPAPALAAIAADPRGEAVRYGRATGSCSCCGRELTDPVSIEQGIGPICVTKWGL
jgi:hypothetical protein